MTQPTKWLSFKDRGEGTAAHALYSWWAGLDLRDRGGRAALRRLNEPADCVFQSSYHDLRQKLAAFGNADPEALAAVAILVASVRDGTVRGTFPRRLRGTVADRAVFSELRLQRLVQVGSAGDTVRQMRRALAMLDNKADVADLAHWAYQLAHPVLREQAARAFAYEYFGAVVRDTKPAAADAA